MDERDQILGTQSFATTRQSYRQMVQWMQSFCDIARIGVECTGTYGAGLLRHLQAAGIEVLEVTAADKPDRRRRGKDDDLDAQNAAHAAFARKRTVAPKTRDGMIESLRVLKVCRKTAIAARKVALQLIQNTIICAPDELREPPAKNDAHATDQDAGRLAARSVRLPQGCVSLPDQPQVAGPALS